MSKSNETTPNVPTLRFKSFEQEWEYSTIGKCSISLEYGMNAAAVKYDGKHKYIRITDIDEETSAFIPNPLSSPDGEFEQKYLVKENDILFARTGASVGKSYLYNPNDGELYFAGFLIRARIKPEYNGTFIYYQTKSKKYDRWVKLTSMRSGQPGINSQEYSCYPIAITGKVEQDKIADFLQMIDNRIAVQNKIISDLKVLKKELNGFLISRLIKGKESNCKIEDVIDYEQPTGYIVNSDKYIVDGKTPVLTANKAFFLGYTNEKEGIYDKSDCIIFDDFTLDFKYVDFPFKVKSSAIKILTAKKSIELRYFYEYLLFLNLNTNEHKRHYISEIATLPLYLPSIDEQRRVLNVLNAISSKITVEEKYKTTLQTQKKHLLNAMFI